MLYSLRHFGNNEVAQQRTQSREDDELELDEKWIKENRV